MNNSKTCKFLTETHLSVIACADDNVLQDFLNYIAIENGKPIAECDVDEIDKINPGDSEIVIVRGIRNAHGKQKLQIAKKLTAIKDIAKAHNAHFIVPLEQVDCDPHLVTAQLRGILLRIPESDQMGIHMFVLRRQSMDLKLECEFGTVAGYYLLYNYRENTVQLKEKD